MALEYFYIISLLLDVLLINVFVFWKKLNRERDLVRAMRYLVVAVSITVISSMLAIKLPGKEISLFMQTLHYASTEWMLICLMWFFENYVGNVPATKRTRIAICAYSAACSVSLLLNCVFHHVVDNVKEEVNGAYIYTFTTSSPWYEFHQYFCYFMVLSSVIVLGVGTHKTVKLYRKRYYIAMVLLVLTVALDTLCTIMEFKHDFSLYGYSALGFFFTYFALYHKPKSVITKTLSYLVEDSHNRVMCFDPEDKCIYVNEEARRIYGADRTPEEYEEKCKLVLEVQTFRDIPRKKWMIKRIVAGQEMHLEYNFSPLKDERDNYIGCYFSVADRTQEVERYERQKYLASHDRLTGVSNRDYFFGKGKEMIEENPDKEYCIVCTDIKDFKLINDLFGYQKGNEILVGLGKLLGESIEEGMLCARLNSDRFALLIPKEKYGEHYLVENIEKAQKLLNSSEFQMHVHAGVYFVRPEDTDVSVMCDHAMMAIRTIKDDYDKSIVYYDDTLMNKMIHQKYLLNEFDNALMQHQFVMYLQPQVDTDGKVLGAEALVRWIHPERGMISPGEFIPVFEDSGLIHKLDQYIWEQAAKKLAQWKTDGREDLHISVNISAKDFYYLDIYKFFTELVASYEIAPDNLKLEITETALMQDLDKQLVLLGKLQSYGFHVEIDDFGSGYSSLNMLKNIRADVLKIDMGFLREIQDHERTKIILGMVVDLAKKLRMTVITEGVETSDQVDYLKNVGCDMFQGFYFERPIPVEQFEKDYMN